MTARRIGVALVGVGLLALGACSQTVPGTVQSEPAAEPTSGQSEPTEEVVVAAAADCAPETIAAELGRPIDQVHVQDCRSDRWALVWNGSAVGDATYVAENTADGWRMYSSFPATICDDTARADGVPEKWVASFPPCRLSAAADDADLGLSVSISSPACDGAAAVILASATDPARYAADVQAALDAHPGAQYLRTDRSCGSLRDRDDDGNAIYAVYRVVGHGMGDLCAALPGQPTGSYGKLLDDTSDPSRPITC